MQLQDDVQEHVDRVIARSKAFYAAKEPGHYLVRASFAAPVPKVRPRPLNQYDLETQLLERQALQLESARPQLEARRGFDDDTIPAVNPHFGIAEHSAWLGMDVVLQSNTCLPVPRVRNPEDLDRMQLSEDTRWFGYMKRCYEFLKEQQDGTFVLGVRGTMMPMDMANALRGDDLFMDVLTDPQFTHRLMQFCTDAVAWYYPKLRSWCDELDGGHRFGFGGGWLGPNALGHTSNDAAMLCGPDVYEEFGFPYEQQLLERFDACLYHIHNQHLHYVPRLAQLRHLSLLEVSQDPQTPHPLEDLPRVLSHTGDANLTFNAPAQLWRDHIGELADRNVFCNVQCRTRKEAEQMVSFIRKHSKPLE